VIDDFDLPRLGAVNGEGETRFEPLV